MTLFQTTEAVDAAGQAFGPIGVLLLIIASAVVAYLVRELHCSQEREQDLVDSRAAEAKAYANQLQQTMSDHAAKLRDLERDTLDTLNDVIKLLDALESNDADLRNIVTDTAGRIEQKVDKIKDHVLNS